MGSVGVQSMDAIAISVAIVGFLVNSTEMKRIFSLLHSYICMCAFAILSHRSLLLQFAIM
jgi:hypothetical protein